MPTLTPSLLARIMGCSEARAAECFDQMVIGMRKFNINTPRRILCFLTQVKWESGGLRYFAEIYSGEKYNGRADLGNTRPGDGPRYKGGGPIQVTGRSNYTAASKALGIDFVGKPELARSVQYGFLISCWWWEAHGGNRVADQGSVYEASVRCGRLVNRGNANSPHKAQDEGQRIAAFYRVQSFGDLSLPGGTPASIPSKPAPGRKPSAVELAFPLGPDGLYFGPNNPAWYVNAVSGYAGTRFMRTDLADDVARWIKGIQRAVGATQDGRYGPDTQAKVAAWQRKNGLSADGLVGATTYAKMGLKK